MSNGPLELVPLAGQYWLVSFNTCLGCKKFHVHLSVFINMPFACERCMKCGFTAKARPSQKGA
jgi:hypothetical protein